MFCDALSYNDLFDMFDLGFTGSPFTWQATGVKSRLDRVVASPSWSDIFTNARVLHLPPIHSDHIPILLGVFLSPNVPIRKVFRF